MPDLSLEKFIYSVKREILNAQGKHQGELALFKLKSLDLEISMGTTVSGEGDINLAVVQLGSDVAKEQTHTIKLSFEIVEQTGKKKIVESGSILLGDTNDDQIIRMEDLEYIGPLDEENKDG